MKDIDKNKIKQSAAALTAGAAMLFGGLFTSPADLPDSPMDKLKAPPAIELVLPDLPEEEDEESPVALPEEEKKKKRAFSSWFEKRNLFQRILIAVAFAAICWIVLGFLYLRIAAALPALVNIILKTALIVFLSLLTYAAVAKAILPHTPLKKILNWKPVLAIVIAACLLSFAAKFIISSLFVHS